MKKAIVIIAIFLPWIIRRQLLKVLFGYKIHKTARIGFSYIFPKMLVMEANTRIGNLTVCKGIDLLCMKNNSCVGNGNWITGFPSGSLVHFVNHKDRRPQLIMGEDSAITHRHIIDCTNSVTIGSFSTFAGYRSQIVTHSIDLENSIQSSLPVTIGSYCFVGTDCVILGGGLLPDFSILGAKSLLNKKYSEGYYLYAGVPARPIKKLSPELAYFSRKTGFVK
jgi:acetyltransferase-like isoleucine patch superfamily enzyme